jgi:hypothetical protein
VACGKDGAAVNRVSAAIKGKRIITILLGFQARLGRLPVNGMLEQALKGLVAS